MLIKLCNENLNYSDCFDYIDEYVKNRTIEAIVGCSCLNVYEDYLEFLNEHNYKNKITQISFSKRLCFKYNLTSKVKKINGKVIRIMIKK